MEGPLDRLEIVRAENGWAVVYPPNENGFVRRVVFEAEESFQAERKHECEAWIRLLWHLAENIGVQWNKHERFNVKVEILDRGSEGGE